MRLKYSIIIIFSLSTLPILLRGQVTNGQDTLNARIDTPSIKLDNSSFEAAFLGNGVWFDCGFVRASPPNILPNDKFQMTTKAFDQSKYLGLVTRENNTWDGIGQRLKTRLLANVVYNFSLYACKSNIYTYKNLYTGELANYSKPVILRIWGGSGYCAKEELLVETQIITNEEWKKLAFSIKPKSSTGHILIEAFYKVPTLFPYNGNVLIDNFSDFVPQKAN